MLKHDVTVDERTILGAFVQGKSLQRVSFLRYHVVTHGTSCRYIPSQSARTRPCLGEDGCPSEWGLLPTITARKAIIVEECVLQSHISPTHMMDSNGHYVMSFCTHSG